MLALLMNPLFMIALLLSVTLVVNLIMPVRHVAALRCTTLVASITALIIGVLSCLGFDKSTAGFQYLGVLNFIPEYNLSFTFGVDGLSMVFLLLTLFIFPILFVAAWSVSAQPKQFWNHLLGMELLLVLTFTTLDILYFFILFESLLIPMFILIGVWGARERKIKAAYYFFLYTLFGSLFMLFGVFYLYFLTGSTNYFVLLNSQLGYEQQFVIWLCFFIAFAVKMPLFPLHIWLPEAHVEAPTVGSMLLASLLLKLGGYGFLRFSLTFLSAGSFHYTPLVATCALMGVIYGSLSTIRQIDLKRVIAYSSVAHMNLVMLGLFSGTQQGLEGAIYLMVGHGVVSTALFFCVGVLYDRHHSRLLRYYGGLVTVMPLFSGAFFIFTLANMGFPGTSNFLGELLVFIGIFHSFATVALLSTPGIVLGAVYSTLLYARVIFGSLKEKYNRRFTDLTRREAAILLVLTVMMIALGVASDYVLSFVHVVVKTLVVSSPATAGVEAAIAVPTATISTAIQPLISNVAHSCFVLTLLTSALYEHRALVQPTPRRSTVTRNHSNANTTATPLAPNQQNDARLISLDLEKSRKNILNISTKTSNSGPGVRMFSTTKEFGDYNGIPTKGTSRLVLIVSATLLSVTALLVGYLVKNPDQLEAAILHTQNEITTWREVFEELYPLFCHVYAVVWDAVTGCAAERLQAANEWFIMAQRKYAFACLLHGAPSKWTPLIYCGFVLGLLVISRIVRWLHKVLPRWVLACLWLLLFFLLQKYYIWVYAWVMVEHQREYSLALLYAGAWTPWDPYTVFALVIVVTILLVIALYRLLNRIEKARTDVFADLEAIRFAPILAAVLGDVGPGALGQSSLFIFVVVAYATVRQYQRYTHHFKHAAMARPRKQHL